uniref:Coiled-coil domain containing 92Bb n=1 Tax=Poecilia formosa TaxID=48698 RepID=A0A087XW34_POEFO
MDAGTLEQQVASVDRGICFLKQEHLAMLTGLQLEITHLKRRCHELSCELDSKFPNRNTAGKNLDLEEEELAARCEAAERLLERQQCMMVTVRGELRAGRARAVALGRSLREEERRFLEELKRRSHKITLLNRELQRQNVMTTTLHHELHGARLKLFQQRPDWPLSPHPGASSVQPQERHRKNISVREERVRACIPQERVTSPQSPHPMPDPALFLVPLRYRLLRWSQPMRLQDGEEGEDEWEDIEDSRVPRRVDMGAGEGET